MSRKTKVPALPSPTANNQLDFAKAVKGIFDVREGYAGDPLDANVTFRDLVDSGVISVSLNSVGGIGGVGGGSGGSGGGSLPDLTVPPATTGLTATAGITSIILQWDSWAYGNHAYTEIWRSSTSSFGGAVLIGTSQTRFYTDAVGKVSQTYWYWVRFRSEGDVPGPFNSVSGTSASTSNITSNMIENLVADKITAGYTSSVDIEAGTFAGSRFYIGGIVTYEYSDPLEPTKRTGIASVAFPSVALDDDSARFNVDFFRIFNGTTFEIPFEVAGGVVRAKRAFIEDLQVTSAKIDHIIQSTNWNGAYTAPAPSADPNYSAVTLLLNFDGGTTVDQSSLANVPALSSGFTYTSASPLAGAQSVVSTTAGQLTYASSTAFNQRSVYTLEFRIRRTSGDADGFFMGRSAVQYIATSGLSLSITGYGGAPTVALTSGVNHHIALCSDGTTLRVFRDGVLVTSTTALAENLAAQPFGVLGIPGRPDLPCPVAVIDAVRLTQGVARYTANFTPPSGALPGGPTAGFFTSFGTAGWAISKWGDVAINSLYSRGAIAGGGFSPTDWAWPASGGGFFVGPQGIRLGREASGQFFEVTPAGVIRMPGLTVSGGSATFSGNVAAGTITTDAIQGGAASSASSATSSTDTVQLVAIIPAGASAVLLDFYLGPATLTEVTSTTWGGSGKDSWGSSTTAFVTGPLLKELTIAAQTSPSPPTYGTPTPVSAIIISPTPGTYRFTCKRTYFTGTMRLSALILKR